MAGVASLARDVRLRLDWPAQLALAGAAPIAVQVIDLSSRGAFVETEAPARPGFGATLCFEVDGRELRLDAVVARRGSGLRDAVHPELDALVVRATGLGLRFVSLGRTERQQLGEVLKRLRREG